MRKRGRSGVKKRFLVFSLCHSLFSHSAGEEARRRGPVVSDGAKLKFSCCHFNPLFLPLGPGGCGTGCDGGGWPCRGGDGCLCRWIPVVLSGACLVLSTLPTYPPHDDLFFISSCFPFIDITEPRFSRLGLFAVCIGLSGVSGAHLRHGGG